MCREERTVPPLALGSLAPGFRIRDARGLVRTLQEFRGTPVILAFYPASAEPEPSAHIAVYNRLAAAAVGQPSLLGIAREDIWRELAFDNERVRLPLFVRDQDE